MPTRLEQILTEYAKVNYRASGRRNERQMQFYQSLADMISEEKGDLGGYQYERDSSYDRTEIREDKSTREELHASRTATLSESFNQARHSEQTLLAIAFAHDELIVPVLDALERQDLTESILWFKVHAYAPFDHLAIQLGYPEYRLKRLFPHNNPSIRLLDERDPSGRHSRRWYRQIFESLPDSDLKILLKSMKSGLQPSEHRSAVRTIDAFAGKADRDQIVKRIGRSANENTIYLMILPLPQTIPERQLEIRYREGVLKKLGVVARNKYSREDRDDFHNFLAQARNALEENIEHD